ncbi:hypothetical protein O3P69_005263 [Scylla paramamosain]|uniref:Uncharacterized protein n=1 Tax=Scylla paramamosain TaxID=85552 RepID=A0AAW0UAT2_SCYPA
MTRLERKWSGSEEEGMGGRLTHEVAKDKEEKGVQDDSHDTPEDRHSLEVDDDAKLAQVTTFEELMRMAGTHGRWNIAIITICALGWQACITQNISVISLSLEKRKQTAWRDVNVAQERSASTTHELKQTLVNRPLITG